MAKPQVAGEATDGTQIFKVIPNNAHIALENAWGDERLTEPWVSIHRLPILEFRKALSLLFFCSYLFLIAKLMDLMLPSQSARNVSRFLSQTRPILMC